MENTLPLSTCSKDETVYSWSISSTAAAVPSSFSLWLLKGNIFSLFCNLGEVLASFCPPLMLLKGVLNHLSVNKESQSQVENPSLWVSAITNGAQESFLSFSCVENVSYAQYNISYTRHGSLSSYVHKSQQMAAQINIIWKYIKYSNKRDWHNWNSTKRILLYLFM